MQLEVFANPIVRARNAYPLVVVLQADLANTGRERIVAPLVPRSRLQGTTGRLTPHVDVAGVAYVVLIPKLTAMPTGDLRNTKGSLAHHREAIVAAIDHLFLGV
ncbi:MAG: CcdB family protein [Kofleriaceae bacterium]